MSTFALASLLALAAQVPQSQPASAPAIPAPRPYDEARTLPAPRAGAVRIFVVRHGESVGNATRDDPGRSEAEKDRLTDQGRAQARAAGAMLEQCGVVRLCHSPAVRARESAEAAATAFVTAPPALAELGAFGPLRFGTAPAGGGTAPALLAAAWRRGADLRLAGGESLADLATRYRSGAVALCQDARSANGPVALFAHGETLLAWLMDFRVEPMLRGIVRIRIQNGAVAAIDLDADGRAVCVGYFVPEVAESRPGR
jgi:broad specificity phosphatase PhoE